MPVDLRALGSALAHALETRGVSLRAAASEIGVAAATLSRISNAKMTRKLGFFGSKFSGREKRAIRRFRRL